VRSLTGELAQAAAACDASGGTGDGRSRETNGTGGDRRSGPEVGGGADDDDVIDAEFDRA
jgi:hypothetical protein